MLDAIIDAAKAEKIDLGNLLVLMRAESGVQPNRVIGDEVRHRLFSSGLLNDLAKN